MSTKPLVRADEMSAFVAQLSRCGKVAGISFTNSADYACELRDIAIELHRIFENQCDGYASLRSLGVSSIWLKKIDDRSREQHLTARLQEIGDAFGFRVIIKHDPLAAAVELRAHSAGNESGASGTVYVPQR